MTDHTKYPLLRVSHRDLLPGDIFESDNAEVVAVELVGAIGAKVLYREGGVVSSFTIPTRRSTLVRRPPAGAVRAGTPAKPGIYRGGSPAEYGLWRLRADGVWLFSTPVAGDTWRRAGDQSPTNLTLLVDEAGEPDDDLSTQETT